MIRWVAPAAHGEKTLPDRVYNENILCKYAFRLRLFDKYTNPAGQEIYDNGAREMVSKGACKGYPHNLPNVLSSKPGKNIEREMAVSIILNQ